MVLLNDRKPDLLSNRGRAGPGIPVNSGPIGAKLKVSRSRDRRRPPL